MRRSDREVTDPLKIRTIIEHCRICRLGLVDDGKAYIVPLNFGFREEQGIYNLYFHGAKEGRKIGLLKKNAYASFQMDTNYQLNEAEEACGYSARFQSVMGGGPVNFMETMEEKKEALQIIMRHNTGKADWILPDKAVEGTCVFRLEVTELSCKEHL